MDILWLGQNMVYSDGSKWEWRTLALTAGVYVGFFFAATEAYETAWAFGFALMVLCMTLHSSLTREALRGHTHQKSVHQRTVGVSLFVLSGSLFAVQRFVPRSQQGRISDRSL